ncbi:hypothetical protein CK203_017074 [Vitis vinifera]|uniref:Uncharacterized protein n=1 Tax=Vitis vinifera TaxID=29760 RepID=A0A438JNI9_VITVI|nr:hypothetical protein CK203_017074 [Vitis vinifera]
MMPAKRGGRCWFAVDSKSFEISVEVYGERCKGIIVERSRGFTSWVMFGSLSLCCLLERVEACCRGDIVQGLVKRWEDGGRSVSKRKRYFGRWVLLVEKLRFLGVLSWDEPRGTAASDGTGSIDGESEGKAQKSYVDVVKTRVKKLGEAVWLQLGEKDIPSERKLMDRCLVGRWGQSPLSDPDMSALENKVLLRGNRWFKESILHLDSQEAFRKIGDCCGGFITVDENTANLKELRWARLLVRFEDLEWPSSLHVAVGSLCYAFQLWWEVKPGMFEVVPVIKNEKGKEREVRDDGEGDSRAGFKLVMEQMHGESAKVVKPCKVGEGGCRKKAQPSGIVSETLTEADGTTGGQL